MLVPLQADERTNKDLDEHDHDDTGPEYPTERIEQVGHQSKRLRCRRRFEHVSTDMSGQANHEADPEAPVQDSRLGNVRPQLRQVLANPGQLLASERVWSALRSRSSGHDRTS